MLAALPKSAHPGALAAIKEIYNAEDIDKAEVAIKAFEVDYGAKYPKAVAKIVDDADVLLEFYKYPAEHWIHLRTTNPIESTFATVRLRTKVTKGPGSRAAEIAMAYAEVEPRHLPRSRTRSVCLTGRSRGNSGSGRDHLHAVWWLRGVQGSIHHVRVDRRGDRADPAVHRHQVRAEFASQVVAWPDDRALL